MYSLVIAYVIFINVIGMFMMYRDKKRAEKGKWRTKEKTLFTIAWMGGAGGILLGSKRFRHKTHHKRFKYGIPSMMILQISLLIIIIYYVL